MKVVKKHPPVDAKKITWEEAKELFPKSDSFAGCVEYLHTAQYNEDDGEQTLLDEGCFEDDGYLWLLGPYPDQGYNLLVKDSFQAKFETV